MPPEPLLTEVLPAHEAFSRFASEWDQLIEPDPMATLFVSHQWLAHWEKSFSRDMSPEQKQSLKIIVIRDDRGITGVCPIQSRSVRRGPLNIQGLQLLGNDYSSRSGIFLFRREEATLMAILVALENLRWSFMFLGRVPQESFAVQQLKSPRHRNFARLIKRKTYCIPIIDVTGTWEGFLADKSKNFRRTVKKNASLLESPRWEVYRTVDATLLDNIMRISKNTWKQKENTSLAQDLTAWEFYQSVLKTASDQKRFLSIFLFQDDQPVACILGIRFGKTLYALKAGYDERVKSMSPGFNVLSQLVQTAFKEPDIDDVDLDCVASRGDYKMRWSTSTKYVDEYYCFRNSITGQALNMGYRFVRQAKQMWKGHYS